MEGPVRQHDAPDSGADHSVQSQMKDYDMQTRRNILKMLVAGSATCAAPALAAQSPEVDVYLDPN